MFYVQKGRLTRLIRVNSIVTLQERKAFLGDVYLCCVIKKGPNNNYLQLSVKIFIIFNLYVMTTL